MICQCATGASGGVSDRRSFPESHVKARLASEDNVIVIPTRRKQG